MNIQLRWQNLWQAIGAASDGDLVLQSLLHAYNEAQRAYHTIQHIEDCLAQFDHALQFAPRPEVIETAIWFHDAIYNPRAHDNEEQSTAWTVRALQQAEVAPQIIHDVERLILITKHQLLPTLPDEQLLIDIDLSILGQSPAQFDTYETQIRQEYAWVAEDTYRKGRAKILQSFLNRANIYLTTPFQQYEMQARENLLRSINKLL